MKRDESEPEEEATEEESSEPETATESVDEESTDNVGDPSVEINVEELIHELEVQGLAQLGREGATRRRLEELMEQRKARRELEDFEDYDI